MNTEQQLRQLESKLDELLTAMSRLRQENQSLQTREARLLEERAELAKKNDVAKAKVEAIIGRLRALEQDA